MCGKLFFYEPYVDGPMRFMAAELQRGRPPANIMAHLALERQSRQHRFAGASRNAPCPCGSERKYKHCCGRAGVHPMQ